MGEITGRPTTYTQELAEQICEKLSTSTLGLEVICRDANLPGSSTVWRWLAKNSDFREMYVRAREFQTELMYDDMSAMVNAPLTHNGEPTEEDGGTGIPLDAGMAMAEIQRRKLAVDVMKFKLVKLQPKRFGDNKSVDLNVKVNHQVTGEQYQKLLEAAASVPALPEPEDYEEAELITDHCDTAEQDFLQLDSEDEDDDLG